MSASLSPNGGVQRGLSQQSHDMVRFSPYLIYNDALRAVANN
jgi:hypothetical protein